LISEQMREPGADGPELPRSGCLERRPQEALGWMERSFSASVLLPYRAPHGFVQRLELKTSA
jgi:hypothetical protein